MNDVPAQAVEVFYSYAHEDEALRDELNKHLSRLRRQGIIKEWHDRQLVAGTEWEREIDMHLNTASIILLLISADFMASDYCYGIEMQQAMERHAAGQAHVIPIILRPVDWEGAPFSKLLPLPTDAKPITTWNDRDLAYVDVVKGIREAIVSLNAHFLEQGPTRLPYDSVSYFMSLETYLQPSERRFPTESDFQQDWVYLPETYISQIKEMLHKKKRALLIGRPAAGKTVLAIALAKQLQDKEGYKVSYQNGSQAEAGDGRKWYTLVHTHDRDGILYILDNCHLAPKEVNEFCRQWEEKSPAHAQCILISRPSIGERKGQFEESYDYFEACAEEQIEIQPEDIYEGVMKKYEAAYRRQDPNRYVALKDDDATLLARQHAHNLVASKSRLEAWRNLGHRLSDIKQEDVYRALEKKYLFIGGEALPALCALRQYEIRTHKSFVETKLSQDEVRQLREENLLTSSIVQNYGKLYDLVFHPAEAREVFEAYVYSQHGNVVDYIETEILNACQAYLMTKPPNYMSVYEGLSRHRQRTLLKQFLTDRDLQNCAASQFKTGKIVDTIRYVHRLSRFDPARARELLGTLERDVGIRGICSKIVGHTFQDIVSMLRNLQQIDAEVARKVVAAIDMEQLARQGEVENLQLLSWLLHAFKGISPMRAEALFMKFPVQVLATKAAVSSLSSIGQIINCMQKFGYSPAQVESFVQALDVEQLVQRAEKENLQHLYWLLHALKKSSASTAEILLKILTPAGLASLCRSKKARIADVGQFRKVSTDNFWRLFLRQFSVEDMVDIFNRSPLGSIGTFLQYEYSQYDDSSPQQGYALFQEQFLVARLASEPLDEIGEFIHRIQQVPGRGKVLGYNVLELLVKMDLSECIAKTDLTQFALLLHNARSVDKVYPSQLLVPLRQAETVRAALKNSSVGGIQMLIYNVAAMDRAYMQPLREGLQATDLTSKLEKAQVRDIGLFLWNVYAYIDQGLAQQYCQIVDMQQRSPHLQEAALYDLCRFLWNIATISNLASLRTFEDPIIEERMRAAWEAEIVLGAALLGVLSIAHPTTPMHKTLPPIQTQLQKEHLASWHTRSPGGPNAYLLALMLHGLRTYDEAEAQVIVRKYLPVVKTVQLLEAARESIKTPISGLLLEETLEWIVRLPTR